MIYANKRTILVVLIMCAIALSSVKAQEVRASIGRTRKTAKNDKKTKSPSESPSESPSDAPSDAACKKSRFIARFLTKSIYEIFGEPEDSQIIEGFIGTIVVIAEFSKLTSGYVKPEGTLIEDLGNEYSVTVEKNCGRPGYCSFSTETTICVLESAERDWANTFLVNLATEFLGELENYFKNSVDIIRFEVDADLNLYLPSSVSLEY